MNASTIAVHWHDESQPVYSVDFQKSDELRRSERLATGGGDNNIRLWQVKYNSDNENTSVEYLGTLRKHTQAVNTVRFDATGKYLASGGDDGMLIVWTRSDKIIKDFGAEEDEDDIKESWVPYRVVRSSMSEIYDLSWSPDSKYIATGSMDNITRIYELETGQQIYQLTGHSHYVQGVCWDPLNEYIVLQSADRSIIIHSLKSSKDADQSLEPSLYHRIARADVPTKKISPWKNEFETGSTGQLSNDANHETVKDFKNISLYYPETLQSFFRRLAFSPDGNLLITPLGIIRPENTSLTNDVGNNDDSINTVYIYIRSGLNKPPVCHIPGFKKPAIALAFSPVFYQIDPSESCVFKLPYKMVFAIATQDSIIIYDTQKLEPLGHVSNLHYSTITDLCWDTDGLSIIVSSADGFCSCIRFDTGVFGKNYIRDDTAARPPTNINGNESSIDKNKNISNSGEPSS